MKKFTKGAIAAALLVGATTPALADTTTTVDTTFYSDLMAFVQAQFAFEGAEYGAFQSLGLKGAELQKLTNAFAALNSTQLTLVQYLQSKLTVS